LEQQRQKLSFCGSQQQQPEEPQQQQRFPPLEIVPGRAWIFKEIQGALGTVQPYFLFSVVSWDKQKKAVVLLVGLSAEADKAKAVLSRR